MAVLVWRCAAAALAAASACADRRWQCSAEAAPQPRRPQQLHVCRAPPAGLEPAIFGLEVRRLVHQAKGAVMSLSSTIKYLELQAHGTCWRARHEARAHRHRTGAGLAQTAGSCHVQQAPVVETRRPRAILCLGLQTRRPAAGHLTGLGLGHSGALSTAQLQRGTQCTPCGTRARNLRIRGPTPCPLGQGGDEVQRTGEVCSLLRPIQRLRLEAPYRSSSQHTTLRLQGPSTKRPFLGMHTCRVLSNMACLS